MAGGNTGGGVMDTVLSWDFLGRQAGLNLMVEAIRADDSGMRAQHAARAAMALQQEADPPPEDRAEGED
jgi:hypothetical protein